MTEGERSQLRSVVGSLAWITRQTRPDVSYKVSKLRPRCNCATIRDLIYANATIEEAKQHASQGIHFTCPTILTGRMNCILVTISDASWGNEQENKKQQRARMTILADPELLKDLNQTDGRAFRLSAFGRRKLDRRV